MPNIHATVSCNVDSNLLKTLYPLFENGSIDAVERSFDSLFKLEAIPDRFLALLKAYSENNRLIGHGIYFSLFSGKWSDEQEDWLENLRKHCETFSFSHITEHFGFMTGKDFHNGAPLSLPYTPSTLSLGQDRLKRISQACKCPVGLENLAFSYSLEEVKIHGQFLFELIQPINGFIILDLHNIYCQVKNFDISFNEIIKLYPLDKVREIHVSGGDWEPYIDQDQERLIRRDTHDDSVPEEVFDYLKTILAKCKNIQFVTMEQLGGSLTSNEKAQKFHRDFSKMKKIIAEDHESRQQETFLAPPLGELGKPLINLDLFKQQNQLSQILEKAQNVDEARKLLSQSKLHMSDRQCENRTPYMLDTAIKIAQKWEHWFS